MNISKLITLDTFTKVIHNSFPTQVTTNVPLPVLAGITVYLGIRLIRPIVSIVIPSIETFKAAERQDDTRLHQLSKYWITFGAFCVFETLIDHVAFLIPFYHETKLVGLVLLRINYNGRPIFETIYDKFLFEIVNNNFQEVPEPIPKLNLVHVINKFLHL